MVWDLLEAFRNTLLKKPRHDSPAPPRSTGKKSIPHHDGKDNKRTQHPRHGCKKNSYRRDYLQGMDERRVSIA